MIKSNQSNPQPHSREKKRDSRQFSPTFGDIDLHLFGEGKHERIYDKLGAHPMTHERRRGVAFAVWAPQASTVSVVGNFNQWDGSKNPMRRLGRSGVWELFIPRLKTGELYKFEIKSPGLGTFLKADPYAFMMEVPPDTSSIIFKSKYRFRDRAWLRKRAKRQHFRQPLSIYEVHFGSWRRVAEENNRPFTYREMAEPLAAYVQEMG
ncbi:MAG TPA: hypothetical protein VJM12_00230, partial [Pyrinomonadaceae bacterium]|nr:hypothetical protein [Pyrinomonadaceae bacterium]